MNQLFELFEDILSRSTRLQEENVDSLYENWKASLEYIDNLLYNVENPYTQQMLNERYMKILSQSRKVPIDRA